MRQFFREYDLATSLMGDNPGSGYSNSDIDHCRIHRHFPKYLSSYRVIRHAILKAEDNCLRIEVCG